MDLKYIQDYLKQQGINRQLKEGDVVSIINGKVHIIGNAEENPQIDEWLKGERKGLDIEPYKKSWTDEAIQGGLNLATGIAKELKDVKETADKITKYLPDRYIINKGLELTGLGDYANQMKDRVLQETGLDKYITSIDNAEKMMREENKYTNLKVGPVNIQDTLQSVGHIIPYLYGTEILGKLGIEGINALVGSKLPAISRTLEMLGPFSVGGAIHGYLQGEDIPVKERLLNAIQEGAVNKLWELNPIKGEGLVNRLSNAGVKVLTLSPLDYIITQKRNNQPITMQGIIDATAKGAVLVGLMEALHIPFTRRNYERVKEAYETAEKTTKAEQEIDKVSSELQKTGINPEELKQEVDLEVLNRYGYDKVKNELGELKQNLPEYDEWIKSNPLQDIYKGIDERYWDSIEKNISSTKEKVSSYEKEFQDTLLNETDKNISDLKNRLSSYEEELQRVQEPLQEEIKQEPIQEEKTQQKEIIQQEEPIQEKVVEKQQVKEIPINIRKELSYEKVKEKIQKAVSSKRITPLEKIIDKIKQIPEEKRNKAHQEAIKLYDEYKQLKDIVNSLKGKKKIKNLVSVDIEKEYKFYSDLWNKYKSLNSKRLNAFKNKGVSERIERLKHNYKLLDKAIKENYPQKMKEKYIKNKELREKYIPEEKISPSEAPEGVSKPEKVLEPVETKGTPIYEAREGGKEKAIQSGFTKNDIHENMARLFSAIKNYEANIRAGQNRANKEVKFFDEKIKLNKDKNSDKVVVESKYLGKLTGKAPELLKKISEIQDKYLKEGVKKIEGSKVNKEQVEVKKQEKSKPEEKVEVKVVKEKQLTEKDIKKKLEKIEDKILKYNIYSEPQKFIKEKDKIIKELDEISDNYEGNNKEIRKKLDELYDTWYSYEDMAEKGFKEKLFRHKPKNIEERLVQAYYFDRDKLGAIPDYKIPEKDIEFILEHNVDKNNFNALKDNFEKPEKVERALKEGYLYSYILKKTLEKNPKKAVEFENKAFEIHFYKNPAKSDNSIVLPVSNRIKNRGKFTLDGDKVYDIRNPVEINDVIKRIKDITGDIFYKDRLQKDARGYYEGKKVIYRFANDLDAYTHELAHYLDDKYHNELRNIVRIYPEMQRFSYTQAPDLVVPEGFAEAFRNYIQLGEEFDYYKEFDNFLKSELSEKDYNKVKKLQIEAVKFFNQTARQYIKAQIKTEENIVKKFVNSLTKENAKRVFHNFIQGTFDRFHSIKLLNRKLGLIDVDKNNTYQLFRIASKYSSMVDSMFNDGVLTYKEGEGFVRREDAVNLMDTFEGLDKKQLENLYTVAQLLQELELRRKGKKATPFAYLNEKQIGQEIRKILENNKDFVKRLKNFYKFNEQLLDFYYEMGLITKQARDKIRDSYKFYIPTYRVIESDPALSVIVGKLMGRSKEGSYRQLLGIENMYIPLIKRIRNAIFKNAERKLFKQIINNNITEAGIEVKSGYEYKKYEEQLVGKVLEVMKELGVGLDKDYIPVIEQKISSGKTREAIEEVLLNNPQLSLFYDYIPPLEDGNSKVYSFIDGDKIRFIKINGDSELGSLIIDSFNSIYRQPLPLPKVITKVKRLQTIFITSQIPFMLKNIGRDLEQAITYTKAGLTLKDVKEAISEIKNEGKYYKEFVANGGSFGTYFESDVASLERHFNASKLDKVMRFLSMGEYLSRMAEYIKARKKGYTPQQAVFLANEITTDFSMSGSSRTVEVLGRTAAFFNANLSSWYKDIRELTGDSIIGDNRVKAIAKVLIRGLLSLTPIAILSAVQDLKHKDKYLMRTIGESLTSMYLGNVKIPKAYLLGDLFFKLPKLLIMIANSNKDSLIRARSVEELKQNFINDMMFNIFPSYAQPFINIAMNKNWRGKQIIPDRLKYVSPELQYKVYTPTLYKTAGKVFHISPLKTEEVINSYGGYVVRLVNDVLDYIFWDRKKYGEQPFRSDIIKMLFNRNVRTVFLRTNYGQSYIINKIPAIKGQIKRFKNDLDILVKEGKISKDDKLYKDVKDLNKKINNYYKALKQYYKERQDIYYKKNMPVKYKEQALIKKSEIFSLKYKKKLEDLIKEIKQKDIERRIKEVIAK